MKRLLSLILIFTMLMLVSCEEEKSAYDILTEFSRAYGIEGIIYSPELSEGVDGYITEGLIERVFLFTDGMPRNFAVLLNTHIDNPSECGVFVCSDNVQVARCEEIALERVRLFTSGVGFVKRRGRVVYYSTLSDSKRAEELFKEIIR